MTKFRFKVECEYEMDSEEFAAWSTYGGDTKDKYVERGKKRLEELLLAEFMPDGVEYELTVEYGEAVTE